MSNKDIIRTHFTVPNTLCSLQPLKSSPSPFSHPSVPLFLLPSSHPPSLPHTITPSLPPSLPLPLSPQVTQVVSLSLTISPLNNCRKNQLLTKNSLFPPAMVIYMYTCIFCLCDLLLFTFLFMCLLTFLCLCRCGRGSLKGALSWKF